MAKKDFINVVQFSQEYEGFRRSALEGIDHPEITRSNRVHMKLMLKQLDCQLAMAQQLTMIAQHLGSIVKHSRSTSEHVVYEEES